MRKEPPLRVVLEPILKDPTRRFDEKAGIFKTVGHTAARYPGPREWNETARTYVPTGKPGKLLKDKWHRPILPKHPTLKRTVTIPARTKSGKPKTFDAMQPQDYDRALIVLAVYVQSAEITDWDEFNEPRGGFRSYVYPGLPLGGYPASKVHHLVCCVEGVAEKRKCHRVIMDDFPLRNPVSYSFCLQCWHRLLKMGRLRRSVRFTGLEGNRALEAKIRGWTVGGDTQG